ncbi:hypothetical protein J2Z47_001079 [Cohnella thailandensis]|nr:hypothetical protein [Cohnella thailandensis]
MKFRQGFHSVMLFTEKAWFILPLRKIYHTKDSLSIRIRL